VPLTLRTTMRPQPPRSNERQNWTPLEVPPGSAKIAQTSTGPLAAYIGRTVDPFPYPVTPVFAEQYFAEQGPLTDEAPSEFVMLRRRNSDGTLESFGTGRFNGPANTRAGLLFDDRVRARMTFNPDDPSEPASARNDPNAPSHVTDAKTKGSELKPFELPGGEPLFGLSEGERDVLAEEQRLTNEAHPTADAWGAGQVGAPIPR
jgi:hypothetical protein